MLAAVHAAVHIPKGKVVVLTGSTGAIGQAIAAGVAGSNKLYETPERCGAAEIRRRRVRTATETDRGSLLRSSLRLASKMRAAWIKI